MLVKSILVTGQVGESYSDCDDAGRTVATGMGGDLKILQQNRYAADAILKSRKK